MKGIPSTPTDNIYKFMAISGLWFIAGLLALYVWLVNVQIQLDKDRERSQAYFISVNMERDIKRRLDSIEKEAFDENRLDWVPENFSVEEEKNFLTMVQKNHHETIAENKDVLDSNPGEELQLIKRWDIRLAFGVYVSLMVGLTWFGFSRWVTKTHRVEEGLRELDFEIKEKTLEKLELEIEQIKLTSADKGCS